MSDYKEMYIILFNAITDALEEIENENTNKAAQLLRLAQKKRKNYILETVYKEQNSIIITRPPDTAAG